MVYEVKYSREAARQLVGIRPFDRSAILDQIERILSVHPELVSKAKVKRLRQPAPTQYRLRVGAFRIFYDVDESTVYVVQILRKDHALRYLGAMT